MPPVRYLPLIEDWRGINKKAFVSLRDIETKAHFAVPLNFICFLSTCTLTGTGTNALPMPRLW
jgi:hypothetical protein